MAKRKHRRFGPPETHLGVLAKEAGLTLKGWI